MGAALGLCKWCDSKPAVVERKEPDTGKKVKLCGNCNGLFNAMYPNAK